MSNDNNKSYTLVMGEEEVERIGPYATEQGLTIPEFVLYCARSLCFGIAYAVEKLAETGHVGQAPWDKKD